MTEVMLDRFLLDQIEENELSWQDDIPLLAEEWPVEELSHEVLELLS